MRNPVEIENIERLRLREGINDVELRHDIRELRKGHRVKLTLLTEAGTGETVVVRITSVRRGSFRGELANRPASAALAALPAGCPLAFTTAHIHSIAKGRTEHER